VFNQTFQVVKFKGCMILKFYQNKYNQIKNIETKELLLGNQLFKCKIKLFQNAHFFDLI